MGDFNVPMFSAAHPVASPSRYGSFGAPNALSNNAIEFARLGAQMNRIEGFLQTQNVLQRAAPISGFEINALRAQVELLWLEVVQVRAEMDKMRKERE